MQKLQPRSSQRGMGLVELMISMVIGLILLGTLTYFYLGSRQISRTHDDLSRMEESGRNAMEIIGKAVRQAGFRLDVKNALTPANTIGAIFGTDGGGAAFGATGAATAPSGTLTIRHDPAWVAHATNPIKGSEANCAGTAIVSNNDVDTTTGAIPVNTIVVEYVFSIDAARGMLCGTAAANPAAAGGVVVDNIERMQITYGLRDATGAVTVYLPAAAAGAVATVPPTSVATAAQWSSVAAVRVSLLVRGPSNGITANNSQTYTYNGETVTSADGFLRQVYTSTFTVRNQAL
ncbi:MAG: PilW family protein [Burkholderiaceae bacterium]|nr:PilW family protein [Burkholderiaceae bacterium]